MRTRLLWGSLVLAALALSTFFVPAAIELRAAAREAQEVELLQEAADASAQVDPSARTVPREARLDEEHQYAIYSERGPKLDGDGPEQPDAAVARALTGHSDVRRIGDERVAAVPIGGGHVLRVAEAASEADQHTDATVVRLALIGGIVLLGAAVAAALLARRLTRPLRTLSERAARLGAGDFASPVAADSGVEEVDRVAQVLAGSAARIEQLVERERQLTADTSHQLRTPLTGLRVAVEGELEHPRADPTEILHEALGAIDQLEMTLQSLLDLAREVPPEDAATPIGSVVREAVERWARVLRPTGRALRTTGSSDALVVARRQAITTVLDVLLDNAVHHGTGEVHVDVADAPGAVLVTVSDEGRCDLPEGQLFARRAPGAARTGIGLHLARTLAEADGARIRRRSVAPTSFELLVPRSDGEKRPDPR